MPTGPAVKTKLAIKRLGTISKGEGSFANTRVDNEEEETTTCSIHVNPFSGGNLCINSRIDFVGIGTIPHEGGQS